MSADFLELEERLSGIADELETDVLKFVSPVNCEEQQSKFFEAIKEGKEYNPKFAYLSKNPFYSHFAIDPEYASKLKSLKETNIAKKGFGHLLNKKRNDLINKMEFVRSIGTSDFTQKSTRLYGKPSRKLVKQSLMVAKKKVEPLELTVPAQKLADYLKKELKKRKIEWKITVSDKISAKAAVFSASNELMVKEGTLFTEQDMERLRVHEIETHIYRHLNGKMQPYKLFTTGTGKEWLITEEGLAVFNEELFGFAGKERFKIYAGRVIAIHKALNNSFFETYYYLTKFFKPETAYQLTVRAKRGMFNTEMNGAFTKDYFYLEGRNRVKKFYKKNGSLEPLYYGKISCEDAQTIDEIKELVKPKYLPNYSKIRRLKKALKPKEKSY